MSDEPTNTSVETPHAAAERLAVAAQTATITNVQGDAPHVRRLLKPGGKVEMLTLEPEPLRIDLQTPQAFADWVKNRPSENSACFYDETGLLFVPDLHTRRIRARCEFKRTSPHAWLRLSEAASAAGKAIRMGQKEFVKLLRFTFDGCLPVGALDSFRNVRFTAGQVVIGQERVGKATLDRRVSEAAEAPDGRDLPDEIPLLVPLWHEVVGRFGVRCHIDTDPATGTFAMTPFPGELESAVEAALSSIRTDVLSGDDFPAVYRGCCN